MTKIFEYHLLDLGVLDTGEYRYKVRVCQNAVSQWREIWRLPISCLGTTDALSSWEYVKSI